MQVITDIQVLQNPTQLAQIYEQKLQELGANVEAERQAQAKYIMGSLLPSKMTGHERLAHFAKIRQAYLKDIERRTKTMIDIAEICTNVNPDIQTTLGETKRLLRQWEKFKKDPSQDNFEELEEMIVNQAFGIKRDDSRANKEERSKLPVIKAKDNLRLTLYFQEWPDLNTLNSNIAAITRQLAQKHQIYLRGGNFVSKPNGYFHIVLHYVYYEIDESGSLISRIIEVQVNTESNLKVKQQEHDIYNQAKDCCIAIGNELGLGAFDTDLAYTFIKEKVVNQKEELEKFKQITTYEQKITFAKKMLTDLLPNLRKYCQEFKIKEEKWLDNFNSFDQLSEAKKGIALNNFFKIAQCFVKSVDLFAGNSRPIKDQESQTKFSDNINQLKNETVESVIKSFRLNTIYIPEKPISAGFANFQVFKKLNLKT